METMDAMDALYWEFEKKVREEKAFIKALNVFSKVFNEDYTLDLLCAMKEEYGRNAFRAGFRAAVQILAGGDTE